MAGYEDADEKCLETRLERILQIVEDNGFDGIDSMTSTYYTSELLEDSFLRPMPGTVLPIRSTIHLRLYLLLFPIHEPSELTRRPFLGPVPLLAHPLPYYDFSDRTDGPVVYRGFAIF
jgi:hypothetical protein